MILRGNLPGHGSKKAGIVYDNPDKLLADSQVNVIVETIGGSGFSRELITKALKNGKHVVTANKDFDCGSRC